ncbi:magnesium-dependent phosphatase 1-like [Saccoglossus kowalevskii]|uniref:Magnesium-dependent phosphatase 1-like n=1 Tax=Saccoglossus kowalevskii TaxID=10224 RepID=A0ABM0LXY4_SACKO|nr:PREDICTED: magnesium-dependent phosphatase 1-like [Saccoglossus kowalevskii]
MATATFPRLLPKLIVFDLDETLWPFWVDTHFDPPFQKTSDGKVVDSNNDVMRIHKDVPAILKQIQDREIQIAAASRTDYPTGAKTLLKLYDIDQYFNYKEIYPGCKRKHFEKFHKASGVAYEDMLFFDDEARNIRDISKIGVTSIYVDYTVGLTVKVLEEGLQKHSEKKSKR